MLRLFSRGFVWLLADLLEIIIQPICYFLSMVVFFVSAPVCDNCLPSNRKGREFGGNAAQVWLHTDTFSVPAPGRS